MEHHRADRRGPSGTLTVTPPSTKLNHAHRHFAWPLVDRKPCSRYLGSPRVGPNKDTTSFGFSHAMQQGLHMYGFKAVWRFFSHRCPVFCKSFAQYGQMPYAQTYVWWGPVISYPPLLRRG